MGTRNHLKVYNPFKNGFTGLHVSLDEGSPNTFPKWPQYLHGHFRELNNKKRVRRVLRITLRVPVLKNLGCMAQNEHLNGF